MEEIVGIVLGAGSSRRLGRPKQTLPFGDRSLLAHVVADIEASTLDRVVGADKVNREIEALMGSEDFAFMLQEKPGAYVLLGAGPGAMVHNAHYDFNDDILGTGAAYWATLAEVSLREC